MWWNVGRRGNYSKTDLIDGSTAPTRNTFVDIEAKAKASEHYLRCKGISF